LSTIRILSEHLANQIAAGEVIERPASVVKEFIENAVDAAASHISIQIEGDGTKLIRVVDDGCGMDQDDVLLCLERHATSKLSDSPSVRNQLSGIVTLGFRGEAIPSIASVSRLSITSRPEGAALGYRADIRYGRLTKVHEAGCRRGTVMEMHDLFGNLPARKKFLKTRRTELAHIEEIVKNTCLAQPQLGIRYQIDNRTVFDLPAATDTLEDRVRWFLRLQPAEPLLTIDSASSPESYGAGAEQKLAITGFLLPPEESYGPSAKLKVFVNNRAVRDRMIMHGVIEGLAGFLMKGRTPAGTLFVTLAADGVDVNVHPSKQEVRFHIPQQIHQCVVRAVRLAIEAYQEDIKFSLFGAPRESSIDRLPDVEFAQHHDAAARETFSETLSAELQAPYDAEGAGKQQGNHSAKGTLAGERYYPESRAANKGHLGIQPTSSAVSRAVDQKSGGLGFLVPVGQLMNLYLLCENRDEDGEALVVIDQHAAHERLVFENLKKQFAAQRVAGQALLFPQLIDLSGDQVQIVKRHQQEIERLGIAMEEFGEQSYVVKAVPAILSHLCVEEIIGAIIGQFQENDRQPASRSANTAARIDDILSAMACKAAVKAGRTLQFEEMEDLLNQMQEAQIFSHCPHGRPVFKSFTEADIRKWFHRT
jgi:DNA mismatch repair protein MutL